MAHPINNLAMALRAGAQGTADLAGYDEEFADATARGNPTTQMDKYGQVSGLSVLADVMGQSRSRKNLRELAPKRTAARTAVADNANAQGLYNAKIAANKVGRDAEVSNRNFALTQARDKFAVTREENRVNEATTKSETDAKNFIIQNSQLVDMNRVDDPSVTMQAYVYGGKAYDGDGNQLAPEVWQKTSATGRGGRGGRGGGGKKDGDPLDRVGSPDLVSQILDSEFLEPATGTLDLKRWAGKFGYSTPNAPEGEGERIQALQAKMSDVGIDSVKTNLQGLGINPTDKDLEVAFASIPDAGTQPLAWAIWTRDQYLPMLHKASQAAIRDGTAEPEVVQNYLTQVSASVGRALEKYGASPDASGGTIHVDKNGNRALIGPDGQLIKELN